MIIGQKVSQDKFFKLFGSGVKGPDIEAEERRRRRQNTAMQLGKEKE